MPEKSKKQTKTKKNKVHKKEDSKKLLADTTDFSLANNNFNNDLKAKVIIENKEKVSIENPNTSNNKITSNKSDNKVNSTGIKIAIDNSKWTLKGGQVVDKPPANYISKLNKGAKPIVSLSQEEQTEIKISEEKIKKLLDVQHLEELFFLVHILSEKQISQFLEHYKKSEISPSPDSKVDAIVKQSKSKPDLEKALKNALAEVLADEHLRLRQKISELRKKGTDVFVEDMKTISLPQKIKFFQATSKKEDFYKVKKILQEVSVELKKIEDKIQKKD